MSWTSGREAWRLLAAELRPLDPVEIPRAAAGGRVLANLVRASVDLPPCDMSAMDGYAITEAVTEGASLPVTGTISAGDPPGRQLAAGEAVRIMTGAPVPETAASIVPVEQTDEGVKTVTFTSASSLGSHIRRQGEVVAVGDEVLPRGCPLSAHSLGLLAAHGIDQVPVVGEPSVATLSTGDEIVPPSEIPGPGQLRDSHTDFLRGSGRALGLEFKSLGIARDEKTDLEKHIEAGLAHDVLLITGGVSKGLFDLVENVLDGLGCETLFDAVAIQPGKPLVAARHKGGLVFGLPGNPASVMVCYWLFVRPVLRVLMGHRDGYWQGALAARLAAALPGAGPRDRFFTASVEIRDGELLVTPHVPKGSHDLVAYGYGPALVRARAHSKPAAAGAACEILLI